MDNGGKVAVWNCYRKVTVMHITTNGHWEWESPPAICSKTTKEETITGRKPSMRAGVVTSQTIKVRLHQSQLTLTIS